MRASVAAIATRLVPVVISIVIFALLVQIAGFNGLEVLKNVVVGSVGSPNAAGQSLRWAIPLILMGVGAAISFRSGYFNVGGLGQYYLGCIGATATVMAMPESPAPVAIVSAIAVGTLAGGLWSLIPGLLRVLLGADEVISTLMLNFCAQYLLLYLVTGPLIDKSGSGQGAGSPPIPAAFRISGANGLSPITITVTVVVVAAVLLLVARTSFGILSGIAGRNTLLLKWQGAPVSRIGLASFAITGALAGLAGAMDILGPTGKLVAGLSPQVGNNAMLAALVGGLAVVGTIAAALFFGALTAASLFLPVVVQLPAAAIVVMNGIIALLVTSRFGLFRRRGLTGKKGLD